MATTGRELAMRVDVSAETHKRRMAQKSAGRAMQEQVGEDFTAVPLWKAKQIAEMAAYLAIEEFVQSMVDSRKAFRAASMMLGRDRP